MSNFVPS